MEHSNEERVAIGIDLGTTYSCVGVVQHGKVEIIANDHGQRTTPSCVAYTQTERLVGSAAKNQQVCNPYNTILAVKRLMGRSFTDLQVQEDIKLWQFKVEGDDKDQPQISVQFRNDEKKVSPIEVSALILQKMKQTAEEYLGRRVDDAVITVPAYFDDAQREATKNAGKIAQLNVLRIINEPAAAALAFGHDKDSKDNCLGKVLVFDLGGGTFDVSILDLTNDVFQVLAHAGNNHLGGEDFDNRLVCHFVNEIRRKKGHDITRSERAMSRLRSKCELAKRTLSTQSQADIEIDSFIDGEDFKASITRARFEELNEKLFRSTLEPVVEALKLAKLSKKDIDQVVLVGGSTRIPKIQSLLSDFFSGKPLNKSVNPDEAVATGAAIQAALLVGTSVGDGCHLLVDRTPLTLGLANELGEMEEFIPRNSIIPAQASHNFTTTSDQQTTILFQVYQGERRLVKDNTLLGSFELKGIPPAPKEVPSIQVTFSVDCNNILHCSAVDLATGKSKKITITSNGKLTKRQIEDMIEEGRRNREQDLRETERLKARYQLEEYVLNITQTLLATPDITHWSDDDDDDDESDVASNRLVRKSDIMEQCNLASEWLQDNALAELEEFAYQESLIVEMYNPFIKRLYRLKSVKYNS